MIRFLYDSLYTVSLALTAMYWYCGLLGVSRTVSAYIAVTVLTAFFTLFLQLRLRERLLVTGIAVVGAAGFLFVLRDRLADSLFCETGPVAVLILSLGSFFIGMLMARIRVFRNAASTAIAVGTGLSLEFLRIPSSAGKAVFASFFLLIITAANEIHLRWKRSGDTDECRHMVYTAPFILAAVILGALFKYPDHPYDWNVFVTIWNRVTTAFERVKFDLDGGSDTVMGFSDDGELLHSVGSGSEDILLEIEAPADVFAPVNLTGSIYDIFDGHKWTLSDLSLENMRKLDVYESLAGAKNGSEDYRDVMRSVNINVRYRKSKSRYLFAPSKTESVTVVSKQTDLKEHGGMITFARYNPFRFEAKEVFYKLNTDSPVFYDYMAADMEMSEKEWKDSVSDRSDLFSFERYVQYRDAIEEAFCEDMELSPELRERLDTIFEGARSDYEKCKRLEDALNAMRYTTDTDKIPDTVKNAADFLDHFLLGSGEGFCTHFATAFVLIARAEGLPARYVQGYRININEAGVYAVTGDCAHAWPEVYFKGKGWVTFEPTPGFRAEVSWKTVAAKREEFRSNAYAPNVFDKPEEAPAPEKERADFNPLLIIIPIASVLVFLVLFTLTARAVSGYRFRKLSDEDKLRWFAGDILACLSLMGNRKKENETLSEYTERVTEDIGGYRDRYTMICERLLYSRSGVKEGDPEALEACRREVLLNLKRKNRAAYLVKTLLSSESV